ncbi:MAG: SDR family NAD(P)-dependent oxidoreductase [Phyllobacteriaceae bacterium]|jgi:enediyne polyketide synthase|nr:SDR family NAD(P)-dependent oxidoreductase [Phyllobacteriaceae bacterium]
MSADTSIAIVSMACRFPDAASPEALWRNVLDGRRSFRAIPPERLALADYDAATVGGALSITPVLAGLLTDWHFDRSRFRVSRSGFDAADLAHWLALDTAEVALERVGGAGRLGSLKTAVIVGNTLTGEFTRTEQIPLRLPYLLSKARAAMDGDDLPQDVIETMLGRLRDHILADFPTPNEETLAGGLANTIAGRIANHFDLHGGAWTVDGACASSLLAVGDACTRLAEGSIDVAIAGGVDLSLDPFELVGFSRNGALAADQMRVFDRRSAGFWPGEGCGIVILANAKAVAQLDAEPLAYLSGWGVSTDGAGGLTRPTETGQGAALCQAYSRAGVNPADLGYVEAHGTGTAVGDPVEIRALADLVGTPGRPVPVGSIKANIGHTKAAAGIAGLIKAVSAVRDGIVPPHVSCDDPHPVFAETGARLAPSLEPGSWRAGRRRHAGVSGFGFGGVNAHMVVSDAGPAPTGRARPAPPTPQDAELFLFSAATQSALSDTLSGLRDAAETLSWSAMADAAAHCAAQCDVSAPFRAAILAARPDELVRKLGAAIGRLAGGELADEPDFDLGIARTRKPPRIGFLFPGQAAPVRTGGGIWRRRFAASGTYLAELPPMATDNDVATDIAQPAIMAASCAALDQLSRIGLRAEVAVGHSLGEIAALCWAGALSGTDAVRLARARGRAMADAGTRGGSMARIAEGAERAAMIAARFDLTVACENADDETVIAGDADAIGRCVDHVRDAGTDAGTLAVSHAFHTADMEPAAAGLADVLNASRFSALNAPVISTVTGDRLDPAHDLRALLLDQLISPVRFAGALALAARHCDVFIEVGPGAGLTRLARKAGHSAVSVDAHGPSIKGLLETVAFYFLSGAAIAPDALFEDRRLRPFDPAYRPILLANPCGRATMDAPVPVKAPATVPDAPGTADTMPLPPSDPDRPMLETVLGLVATELALPPESLSPDLRFADDLHLNSLAVGRIVAEVARQSGLATPAALSDFANARLCDLADALGELETLGKTGPAERDHVEGVAPWVRRFGFEWKTTSPPRGNQTIAWRTVDAEGAGRIGAIADGDPAGALVRIGEWRTPGALQRIWNTVRDIHGAGLRHVALVHDGAPVSAFARSLYEDGVFDTIAVVETADAQAAGALLDRVGPGFGEWRIAANGTLLAPVFRPFAPPGDRAPIPWRGDDVVAVTGGARGIGAECALRLAEKTGVRLLLLGRSPAGHDEVAATLARSRAMGIDAIYRSVDVTEPDEVVAAFADAAGRFAHPVSGIMHAAGLNHPQRFADIAQDTLRATLDVKVAGLQALLGAADLGELKAVIGFGSIIGRLGLAGETHYALANAAQTALLAELASANPDIAVMAPEWSVWAGAGMGQRLGTLERLAEEGVEALSLDTALDLFEELATAGTLPADGPCVITSRFGPPRTVDLDRPTLPLRRFLETVRLHYPGIELVVDTRISTGNDPYLLDHMIDGQTVLPGVMMLEAMATAAHALTATAQGNGKGPTIGFEAVRFDRPVVLPDHGDLSVRVAALRRDDGTISCVLKTSADGFAAVHASADIRFSGLEDARVTFDPARPEHPPVTADGFYGSLFFNGGRFETVHSYRRLTAFEITADLDAGASAPWFGSFLPQSLMLGDPGCRDGGLHALQAAVPQRRVVPASVDHIAIHDPDTPRCSVNAKQVRATETTFVFDIEFCAEDGRCLEVWRGASFKAIAAIDDAALSDALFVPWLERELAFATGRSDVRVARAHGPDRDVRRMTAATACGLPTILHRSDGRPLIVDGPDGYGLSVSHHGDTTLVVAAHGAVGCDLEGSPVEPNGSPDGDIRHWCIREALRKCGVAAPPRLAGGSEAGDDANKARLADVDTIAGHAVIARRWRDGTAVAVALGPDISNQPHAPAKQAEVVPSAAAGRAVAAP